MKVSVIIPVIREDKAKRCIEAVNMNAGIPPEDFEVLFLYDKDRIGVARMVKKLVAQSAYENVCFLGDDTIPQKDFLKNGLRAMSYIPDGWGMVSFNDNPTTTRSAAHWICSKKLLPHLDGEFFHTGYKHCFCDDELRVRCELMDKFIYAYDAVVDHDHFVFRDGKPRDPDKQRVYADKVYNRDKALFEARIANDWKTPRDFGMPSKQRQKPVNVLIGIPSGDMWFAGFAMCLVQMVIHTFIKNVRVQVMPDNSVNIAYAVNLGVVNQNSSIIEVGRNTIVQTAINMGVDYLLTLDSDMTFPADLLVRLLDHNKDIVCCDASRRRAPYTSVVLGMDDKPINYNRVKRKLIEVKNGTSAVQLVSVKALKRIKPPHYAVPWEGSEYIGEDYFFTKTARSKGIRTYCDIELSKEIGHIGLKEFKIRGK